MWLRAPVSPPVGGAPPLLVVGHDAGRAGAQIALLTLLEEWQRTRPFPFRLILVRDGVLRHQFERQCPTLVLTDRTLSRRRTRLDRFLTPRPWAIYSNTVVNGPLLEELRWLECPVVTHVHELQSSIRRWAPGAIMESTLRRSTYFIACADPVARNLAANHGVPPDAITVVRPFIHGGREYDVPPGEDALSAWLRAGGDPIIVFGCGSTDWRKGPDLFVDIAALACGSNPRLRFAWIGHATARQRRDLEEQIRMRRLEQHVSFLGESAAPRAHFRAGHVFLLSSREDPFPLVALEAADAGLPIVCFDGSGGMPDFVGDGCGRLVPFADATAAAAAIVHLAGDERLRMRLGAQAREKVARYHSAGPGATHLGAILAELRQSAEPRSQRREVSGPQVR